MRKGKLMVLIIIILTLIVTLTLSSNFIVDIQWFYEVNYLQVYFTKVVAIGKLFVPIFLIFFAGLVLYLSSLSKNILPIVGYEKKMKIRKTIIFITTMVSGVLAYIIASSQWYRILQFTNSIPFNYKDPIFNMDISFYVFRLPLIQNIYNSIMSLLVIVVLITLFIYFILKTKNKLLKRDRIVNVNSNEGFINFAGKQLAIVSAIFMIMISLGYVLEAFNLVYSKRGFVYGASYTDVNVTLLFYRAITIAALLGAFIGFFSIRKSKFRPIIFSLISIVVLIILQSIVSSFVQQFIVKSNEVDFEKKYIGYNIEYTRRAFNIENISENNYEPKTNITLTQLNNNRDIIDNLKVNSVKPVLNFYKQVQLIKNYYEFNDVDTDRYKIDDKYTQVFISSREVNSDNISTWQNKHLRYTHGYGVVMSKVNSVTSEGQPDFIMKDIPTENSTNIKLDNPRIYFGEGSNDYIIINNEVGELDYPTGTQDKTFNYSGNSGIKMNLFNRVLFSIYEGSPKILFSGAINGESKIILNKNIVKRVKSIAPFLQYDEDPYIVINDGRLFWIMDAYTTSDKYPFSEPYNGINYIRNSVKIIIDAYNGDTNFYIVDKNDPIAISYSKIFKGLFKDDSEIPNGLREHFRYPQDIFKIQSDVFSKYHVKSTKEFFTQEDLWDVSSNLTDVEGNEQKGEAFYLITKLPEEKKLEMILFEYFNMKGKQNMVGVLGARMDETNYGQLMLYKFPPQKTVYSPYLFKNRILQDPDISKEISLWQGKGSQVVYGDTIIVPIEDSLLYLDTIYLKADTEHSMPEMKRVIVSNGDKIVMEETVDKALEKLFDYKVKSEILNNKGLENTNKDYIKKAKELYTEALEAQKQGDWAKYGECIKSLGDILNKINE
jgi:hypothetical protein